MNSQSKPAAPAKSAQSLQSERAAAVDDRAHALLADLERVTNVVKHELARPMPGAAEAAKQEAEQVADCESLETYLERFMERMTGKKAAAPPAHEPSSPAATLAAMAATQPLPRTPQVTEVIPSPPLPPPPREPAPAPERREQLTALRQVANQNARNAVILHDCQALMIQSRALLAAALGASCLSSGLAIVALVGQSSGARVAAVVTCLLGLVLSCGFCGLYRRLRGRVGELQTDE
jgi:hypothetical protein